ncbi:MAG: virulence RhuM family protein [Clostridium sp.]|nr:virulence RhuM family protein [Clostridium sp.]
MNTNNNTQLVIYQSPNGETQLDVMVKGDTIWLTQRQIADLFGTKVPAISKHLKNIFASGELERDATISKMETVVNRGFRGSSVEVVDHYNLDAILSVGYRVNSKNATAFRIWANKSRTEEKDTMVKVIVNLINKNN